MRLIEILRPEHIVAPLVADTFRAAVMTLVQRLVETGAVDDASQLERLTGEQRVRDVVHVGDRVLLPHMRTDAVDHLVVAIGVAPEPLRPAPDAQRAMEQVVVLVLAPPAAANHYLQMVAALARALKDESVIDRLIQARSPDEVLAIAEIRELVVQPRLTVRDIMTQSVFRVYPDTPVGELLELVTRHELKAVPVVNEKREVLGVVTDRDLLRHFTPNTVRAGGGARSHTNVDDQNAFDIPVRDIMSRSVMCISEDQGLADVAAIMVNKDVERLPVVSEGKLTGFLTRGDILRKLYGR